jgi:hypothetical protein
VISLPELMRQVAEYEAPEPDPGELAEGKARLLAWINGADAAPGRDSGVPAG